LRTLRGDAADVTALPDTTRRRLVDI